MRNLLWGVLLAATLVGCRASAQYRDQYGNPYPPGRGRYSAGPGRFERPEYRSDAVRRAIADLDRAESVRFAGRREWRHRDDARKDLLRFEEKWARGHFDRGKLDGAIGHLDALTRSPQVHPRDRELFGRNVAALRELRYHSDIWRR